uniref:Metalloendopeptidase n=1 Tax=Knipowitschia caucasica TaxID=637954 RepID=A0AAV2MQ25_KNICA
MHVELGAAGIKGQRLQCGSVCGFFTVSNMAPYKFSVLALLLLSAYCCAEECVVWMIPSSLRWTSPSKMRSRGTLIPAPPEAATLREKSIITRGLESFSSFSCIRFRPSRSSDRDWLSIESKDGCWSFVGRRGGKQEVSLARRGCLYHNTVQHELLHALGFNHEQTRSDRDSHIKVLLQNVVSGMEHNFRKITTLNQGTSYDYGSVMQYHRTAFSKNGQPTMVPIPNSNVHLGGAREMSASDKKRLNSLYKCYPSLPNNNPSRDMCYQRHVALQASIKP